jgi:hypothetical protein
MNLNSGKTERKRGPRNQGRGDMSGGRGETDRSKSSNENFQNAQNPRSRALGIETHRMPTPLELSKMNPGFFPRLLDQSQKGPVSFSQIRIMCMNR